MMMWVTTVSDGMLSTAASRTARRKQIYLV
jgi:hypothetical protein